jgi:hypothetical protein
VASISTSKATIRASRLSSRLRGPSRSSTSARKRLLVLMDTPTLDRLGLSDAELAEEIERLREACRRAGGDFMVLWHNHWLVTARQRRLFVAALGRPS